jgi:hypothetical protein
MSIGPDSQRVASNNFHGFSDNAYRTKYLIFRRTVPLKGYFHKEVVDIISLYHRFGPN